VIVAVEVDDTALVVTVNVPVVAPEAIVIELGTVAFPLLLDSVTAVPTLAAGPERVTVPVEEVSPTTVVGLRASAVTVGAVIVSVAVLEAPLRLAVIVDVVFEVTAIVFTVNVPVVAPPAIVIELGTVAEVELLVRVIERPVAGAAEPMVTVPVEGVPPITDVGLTVSDERVGAVIVSVALAEVLFAVAVMLAVEFVATGVVLTVNVAVVAPPATVTVAGTVAELELLLKLTE